MSTSWCVDELGDESRDIASSVGTGARHPTPAILILHNIPNNYMELHKYLDRKRLAGALQSYFRPAKRTWVFKGNVANGGADPVAERQAEGIMEFSSFF